MYANTQVLAQASRRQAERMRQQKVNLSSSGSSALTIGALGGRPKSLERSDVSISIKTTRAGLFAADTLISSRWGSSCTSPLEDKVIRLGLTNALSTKPEDNIEVSCANKPSIRFQYYDCAVARDHGQSNPRHGAKLGPNPSRRSTGQDLHPRRGETSC